MRTADNLTLEQLRDLVGRIHRAMFFDFEEGDWDENLSWDSDTFDAIGDAFFRFGMRPDQGGEE